MRGQLDDSRHLVNLTKKRNIVFTERTTVSLEDWDTDISDSDDESISDPIQTRHVQFSHTTECHLIISHREFTAAERKSYWYTDADMSRMTQERQKVLKRLEKGKPCKEDMTYRGLESWTKIGAQKLDDSIAAVMTAVMDEQDRQWNSFCDDIELIASKSKKNTVATALRARELAKNDRAEVEGVWKTGATKASPTMPLKSLFSRKEDQPEESEKRFRLLRTNRGVIRTARPH